MTAAVLAAASGGLAVGSVASLLVLRRHRAGRPGATGSGTDPVRPDGPDRPAARRRPDRPAAQPRFAPPRPAQPTRRAGSLRDSVLGPGAADVLDALRAATVVVDRDDRVVRASPTAHLLGLVRGDRVAPERIAQAVAQARNRGDHRAFELEVDRGPTRGGLRTVAVGVVPLGHDLVLVTAEDVSEARRLDAVRRDFVANVSHELKTPVGALALLAEAVVDAADDVETVRRFADRMKTESVRLNELVNELIELSRLQDPTRPLALEEVPLDAVVDEAVDAVRTAALAKEITVERGARSGVHLDGDRVQLVAAVRNLLANAVAYSPEATVVRVGVGRGVDHVEIVVEDQGAGISPSDQERIFERFYRVDSSRARATGSTGGTGLGLAIVKHAAARHGGDVTVTSVEGAGSTFTLRLPLEAPS